MGAPPATGILPYTSRKDENAPPSLSVERLCPECDCSCTSFFFSEGAGRAMTFKQCMSPEKWKQICAVFFFRHNWLGSQICRVPAVAFPGGLHGPASARPEEKIKAFHSRENREHFREGKDMSVMVSNPLVLPRRSREVVSLVRVMLLPSGFRKIKLCPTLTARAARRFKHETFLDHHLSHWAVTESPPSET